MHWSDDPEFLARTRRRLGWTQADLAEASGLKPSMIGNIEVGRRKISPRQKEEIWTALVYREMQLRRRPVFACLDKLLGEDFPTKKEVNRALAQLEQLEEAAAVKVSRR